MNVAFRSFVWATATGLHREAEWPWASRPMCSYKHNAMSPSLELPAASQLGLHPTMIEAV